jgi:hypothetical protein
MLDELDLWTFDEAKQNCSPLSSIGDHLPFESYTQFIHVPYEHLSTKTEPMKIYLAKHPRVAVFLVRVDLSDVRHVLIAFLNTDDRAKFLASCGSIILKR